ncbi:hypothetical protein ABVT39_008968 [Epinephelus coioides]
MTMGHEYIIEEHGIVPVDYSCTGVVENNMKWTDGLQQFIEMKHAKSKLTDMTAITNYMSNVGLLRKYGDQIFGLSGTLGQQAETETLQKIYKGIKTCQIPSFKRRKLFEVEGVIVDDEKEWIEKICNVVTAQTNPTLYRDERAVLVICETINRAKVLHNTLGDKVSNKKLYISNNMDNTAIFAKKLEAGDVIIATNLVKCECEIPKIQKKEELFSQYLETLDEVYKSSNNRPADSDLSALNEFWGMWLLTNFNENDSIMDLKHKLGEDLKTARQKLTKRESPSSNLHHWRRLLSTSWYHWRIFCPWQSFRLNP